jgi:hypothetical protein
MLSPARLPLHDLRPAVAAIIGRRGWPGFAMRPGRHGIAPIVATARAAASRPSAVPPTR